MNSFVLKVYIYFVDDQFCLTQNAWWWEVPANPNPVAETCAVRPGCAYNVRLIAHPWDGHTAANLLVELDGRFIFTITYKNEKVFIHKWNNHE